MVSNGIPVPATTCPTSAWVKLPAGSVRVLDPFVTPALVIVRLAEPGTELTVTVPVFVAVAEFDIVAEVEPATDRIVVPIGMPVP